MVYGFDGLLVSAEKEGKKKRLSACESGGSFM